MQRAVTSREAEFGIDHTRTGEALTVVALVHEDMGEEEKATDLWEKLKGWHGEGRFTRHTEVNVC